MADLRIEKLAQVLVDYSLQIREGDLFRIRGEITAEPLIREVYRLAVRRGAFPFVDISQPTLGEIFAKEAPEASLDWVSPIDRFKVEQMTADLVIIADANTQQYAGVDPARLARVQKARRPISQRWMERSSGEDPEIRWCATLLPTNALAQDARMSLADYERFVYHAMLLDTPDPVQEWRSVSERQKRWAERLGQHDEIRVVAEDTDIRFRTKDRHWVSADGLRNFPDGEVFTGPLEESVNGHIRYTFPTVFGGREAEDVRLWFENGVVVRWEAQRGREMLSELLDMDDGARRLGEFAIGTNYSVPTFTKNILFDEKIGGTCHLALGSSIPETGGVNESALHWDMVCDLRDGGSITADGETIHENGQWKI
ncbi:MAG: aminopeptidase [Cytophagales bacterium]|nr:aminopeptidase [Armatimonadota bacterium]